MKKKRKRRRVAPGSPDAFPFTALVGDGIGRNVMVAANNIANIFCLSGKASRRWEYDLSVIWPPLFLSDIYQILFNPYLGIFPI